MDSNERDELIDQAHQSLEVWRNLKVPDSGLEIRIDDLVKEEVTHYTIPQRTVDMSALKLETISDLDTFLRSFGIKLGVVACSCCQNPEIKVEFLGNKVWDSVEECINEDMF